MAAKPRSSTRSTRTSAVTWNTCAGAASTATCRPTTSSASSVRPIPSSSPSSRPPRSASSPEAARLRELLLESFRAAVAAADPQKIIAAHLPPAPRGRTFVAAAGKAAASMAAAVEQHWKGELSGIAITRYGHGAPTKRIRVVEAGHPVPDEAGERAAREILAGVRKLGPDDLLLALLSGGGSSLLSLTAADVPFAELKKLTSQLLKRG